MKKNIINFLWKWVKFANKHPKFMRRLSLFTLVSSSIILLGYIATHQFDKSFLLFFWMWVWALFDWITTSISFQEPKDVGEADDYEDLR